MKNYKIYSLLSVLLALVPYNISAAEGSADETLDAVAKIMVGVTLAVVLFILWLVVVYSEKNDSDGEVFLAPFKKFIHMINASRPIEEEKEILMDHEYDGIRELDNRIPPWFHGLFWGTIIFGIVYMIQYHVIGSGEVQKEEYAAEMKAAANERELLIRSGAFINEETVSFKSDESTLATGKEIFEKNCATCHGNNGEGLVGPNLTDDYWIHGGGIKNIFKVIKYGVQAKGMISWEGQLNPNQMQDVSSYIMTLHGTDPPNQKKPEGEKWEPPAEEGAENAES